LIQAHLHSFSTTTSSGRQLLDSFIAFAIYILHHIYLIMKTTTFSLAAAVAGTSSVLAGITPLQPRQSGLPAIEVKGNGMLRTIIVS
jgi:hypothetical protein